MAHVSLVQHMGDDLMVVNAARVSTGRGATKLGEKERGLIDYLWRNHHYSPFEHVSFTFAIDTSIKVSREHMRHRAGAFNEFSTRYSQAPSGAYLPAPEDVRTQTGKVGDYQFEPVDPELVKITITAMSAAYDASRRIYEGLLEAGVAKELASFVLPLGQQTRYYWTVSLRHVLHFLALRAHPAALREMQQLAAEVEAIVANICPVSYAAWQKHNRPQTDAPLE